MSAPEFLICLNCDTPCYDFEWVGGKLTEVLCFACGNEEPDQFVTEEDLEALASESESSR